MNRTVFDELEDGCGWGSTLLSMSLSLWTAAPYEWSLCSVRLMFSLLPEKPDSRFIRFSGEITGLRSKACLKSCREPVAFSEQQSINTYEWIINKISYCSGGKPMARVPEVARETILSGSPHLRNSPKNNGWILYFRKVAIIFRF